MIKIDLLSEHLIYVDFLKVIEKLSYCQPEQNTQVLHALVIAFGKVCQSSLVLLTWKPGWTCTKGIIKALS